MIHIPIASFKLVGVVLSSALFAVVIVATELDSQHSPFTLWLLGTLVTIGIGILVMLWRLQGRMTAMEVKIAPFWGSLQTKFAKALHKPHPELRRRDILLEKLERLTITPEERQELRLKLEEVKTDPEATDVEKAQAVIMLAAMPLVLEEALGNLGGATKKE